MAYFTEFVWVATVFSALALWYPRTKTLSTSVCAEENGRKI